nr:MAG TPA: hypothetical protein [Caudoviricetes sp.]
MKAIRKGSFQGRRFWNGKKNRICEGRSYLRQ